jgi:hypothetical protein
MGFSEKTIMEAWERCAGQCECERGTHTHFYAPCGKSLAWKARGIAGQGGWEAHHITISGGDGLHNCEILCWECYKSALGHAMPSLFSGFYLDPVQQIQIGDYIKLESGDEGRVTGVEWDSVRIKALEGNDIVVSDRELFRHTVINYGRSSRKAKEPFHFHSLTLLRRMTGLKARNLFELVGILKKASDSVIYYHTHQFLQEHHYLIPEPANDFAVWVADSLGDEVLGERLANVNPFSSPDLEGIREKFVDIIEEHLSQYPSHREAMEGKEFYFVKSVRFIFPTPYIAHDLREFVEALRKVSLGSLYYHIFESRLRSEKGLNDFAIWFMESLGEDELGQVIARLDPYTYTLEGLRSSLIQLVEKRTQ